MFYASPKEYWRESWPNYSHVGEKRGISRHLSLIWIKPNGGNILTWENPNVRTESYCMRKHTHIHIYTSKFSCFGGGEKINVVNEKLFLTRVAHSIDFPYSHGY